MRVDDENVSLTMIFKVLAMQEKTICRTLNMFKNCGRLLVGLVWVPSERADELWEHRGYVND